MRKSMRIIQTPTYIQGKLYCFAPAAELTSHVTVAQCAVHVCGNTANTGNLVVTRDSCRKEVPQQTEASSSFPRNYSAAQLNSSAHHPIKTICPRVVNADTPKLGRHIGSEELFLILYETLDDNAY